MFDLTLREIAKIQENHDDEIYHYFSKSKMPIVILGVRETAKSVAETLIRNSIEKFCFVSDLSLDVQEIEIKDRSYPVFSIDQINRLYPFGYDLLPGTIDGYDKSI